MQISFIILFMIDLYRDNHVRACVFVNFFFKKNFSLETIYWISTKFHRLKASLHCYRKIRPVERYRRSSASSFLCPLYFLSGLVQGITPTLDYHFKHLFRYLHGHTLRSNVEISVKKKNASMVWDFISVK